MKAKNIKKALSLFLAVLMIALALPFTLLTVGAEEPVNNTLNIESVKYKEAKLVSGKIINDGTTNPGFSGETAGSEDESYTAGKAGLKKSSHFVDGVYSYSEAENYDDGYYGVLFLTLDGVSEVNCLNLWCDSIYAEQYPGWISNSAYDIWYSNDGETYETKDSLKFSNVADSNGVNSDYYKSGKFVEKNGEERDNVVHSIKMNGVIAKYIAIAVRGTAPGSNSNEAVFHEITVEGIAIIVPVAVAGMQPSTTDPDAFRFVGTTTGLDVEGVGFKVDVSWLVEGSKAAVVSSVEYKEAKLAYGQRINDGTTNPGFEGNEASSNDESYTAGKAGLKKSSHFVDGVYSYSEAENYDDGYYGVLFLTLDGVSEVNSLNLWCDSIYAEQYPGWISNSAYDIWYSDDGKTYETKDSLKFSNVADSNGVNSDYYKSGKFVEKNGEERDNVVHSIKMNGVIAKYIAIAVRGTAPGSNSNEAVFHEITVDGKTAVAPKTANFTDGTTTVYNSILADGETVSFDGKYVYALALDGVPSDGTVNIDVTPYFIPKGTNVKVYGETGSFEIIAGKAPDVTDTVKVMSYNLCGGQVGNKTLSQRLDYIAAQINSVDPDVVVLNESHNYDPEHTNYDITISDLTKKCDVSYGIVEFTEQQSTNVILYNEDKYTLVSPEIIVLTNLDQEGNAGDEYERTAVFARLKRNSDGREFVVTGIHFDLTHGVAKMQAWQVNDQLAENYGDIRHIVAGDFNFTSKVHDSENGSNIVHTNPFINEGYTDANVNADHTATKDEKVIDFIYSKGFKASGYTVVKADNASSASDHYAVYAELTLN